MKERLKQIAKSCGPVSIIILFIRILCGFRFYSKLKQQYGEDVQLLICPHKGTGDIYMIGIYLIEYLTRKKIANSLFLFRGKSEQKIGELFHINNSIIISERETIYLMRFLAFIGFYSDIHHLHHIPFTPQTEITGLLEGYNSINFDDMFRYYTFELDDTPIEKVKPYFSASKEFIERFFTENRLLKNKTIIISPYASSMPPLPEQIWDRLVERLHRSGFIVATNCIGGKEPPLINTIPISPPFSAIGPILEEAGYFIGWRSGLCDLVSGCKCLKIILYPYEVPGAMWIDWPGKTYAYFGLAKYESRDDLIEIEFDEINIGKVTETIYAALQNEKKAKYIGLKRI